MTAMYATVFLPHDGQPMAIGIGGGCKTADEAWRVIDRPGRAYDGPLGVIELTDDGRWRLVTRRGETVEP